MMRSMASGTLNFMDVSGRCKTRRRRSEGERGRERIAIMAETFCSLVLLFSRAFWALRGEFYRLAYEQEQSRLERVALKGLSNLAWTLSKGFSFAPRDNYNKQTYPALTALIRMTKSFSYTLLSESRTY